MLRQLILIMVVILPLLWSDAFAEDVLLDRKAAALFDSVMSPYCPGRTLSACPSDTARELREDLRTKLAEGYAPEELKAELDRRYGDLAGKPTGQRSAPLALIGVTLFFILGGILVFRAVAGGKDAEEES